MILIRFCISGRCKLLLHRFDMNEQDLLFIEDITPISSQEHPNPFRFLQP